MHASHHDPSGRRPGCVVGALAVVATLALAACGGSVGTASHSTVQVPVLRESASMTDPASALQHQYVKAVRRILPSIVQIRTSSGLGSGIVFDTRGDIVTNAHVAAGSSSFAVTLADGRQFTGRLVGSYAADDLAVISLDACRDTPEASSATYWSSTTAGRLSRAAPVER